MKKASTTLMQATELLGERSRWTKGAFARDSRNMPVASLHDKACKFCAIGAVNKSGGDFTSKNYLHGVASDRGYYAIQDFNDSVNTKHKDIIQVFMAAAFMALSEGN